jgi:hypothetical protein
MSSAKFEYQVIEDNAGGLHLFVWHANTLRFGCYNLEHISHDDFMATLTYIETPGATLKELARWDSQYDDVQAAYDYTTANALGYESIAVYEDGQRTIHPDRMGRAGQTAFGIDAE